MLPKKMLDYAALDVYASYAITKRLCLGLRHLDDVPLSSIADIIAAREDTTAIPSDSTETPSL